MLESRSLKPKYDSANFQDKQFISRATPASLKGLNLEEELLKRYIEAENYLSTIMLEEGMPPNQIAQVMNTLSSILKEIVKMQEQIHNQEKIKRMETAMIEALKLAPIDIQDAFLKAYEASA